ncbi:class I lanthipeptide [Epilithonimonas hominis]|uniref:class I lanthipeptide n=1 Tax=Epilithonimonas hominis TaxID=420404 RepID=UPI00289A595F|nr:class I lanthipeptide [Epilithonimonas hominis]
MKTNKFSALQLNKKAIAKLNDAQLSTVKGGKGNASELTDCTGGGITCSGAGSTIVVQTRVS